MCSLFAHQPESDYEGQTRSLRIGGHCTSIRLEAAFWAVLEEMAAVEGTTLGRFVTTLYDEVLAHRGEVGNFSSLLRCACLVHLARAAGRDVGKGLVRAPFLAAAE
jgi:predicted DNA-binding ribbon-helix-helix protein